jgi:FkbM family methyltransferase
MFDTPILYLIFNRPDLTEITFPSICKIKPKKLFIAADGPRFGNLNDEISCKLVREYVLSKIDWDCQVQTLFRDKNLGCGKAISEAITWLFMHVDKGIIIEDDCLAENSFFYYCQELLDRYFKNDMVMNISGSNLQPFVTENNSYFFSQYTHTWGWATWKRAWDKYNYEILEEDKSTLKTWMKDISFSDSEIAYWGNIFDYFKINQNSTWDYQWLFTLWKYKGVSITPNVNLVSNIGFGNNGTHTLDPLNPYSRLPTFRIEIPLSYPSDKIIISYHLDSQISRHFFGIQKISKHTLMNKFYRKVKLAIKKYLKIYNNISDIYPNKLGIPKKEIKRLKESNIKNDISILFNKQIWITDPFWHLHSINELFCEELYDFSSDKYDPIIIDCGANIGLSTIFFKRKFPKAKVIAIEADPDIFEMLRKNTSQFDLQNLTLLNKAVWVVDGNVFFNASGGLGGRIENTKNKKSNSIELSVQSIRLKSLLDSIIKNGDCIDLLKIDIEGAEIEVIKDCEECLSHVDKIFVEYHRLRGNNDNFFEFLRVLENSGFSIYIKEAWNNLPKPFLYNNYKPIFDLQLNIFGIKKYK